MILGLSSSKDNNFPLHLIKTLSTNNQVYKSIEEKFTDPNNSVHQMNTATEFSILFSIEKLVDFTSTMFGTDETLSKFNDPSKLFTAIVCLLTKEVELKKDLLYKTNCAEKQLFKRYSLFFDFVEANQAVVGCPLPVLWHSKSIKNADLEFMQDFKCFFDLSLRFRLFKSNVHGVYDPYHEEYNKTMHVTINRKAMVADAVEQFIPAIRNMNMARTRIVARFVDEFGNIEEGQDGVG